MLQESKDVYLEHINITVKDAMKTAETLCKLFGWEIRWSGDSIYGGLSYHVGSKNSYLALYENPTSTDSEENTYTHYNALNHLGVVVDDLDEVEKRILDMGYKTGSHADYEPGKRFYFEDENGLEIEVISYS